MGHRFISRSLVAAALIGVLGFTSGRALAAGSAPGFHLRGGLSAAVVPSAGTHWTFVLDEPGGTYTYDAYPTFGRDHKLGGTFDFPTGCTGTLSGTYGGNANFKVTWNAPCGGEITTFAGMLCPTPGSGRGTYVDSRGGSGTWTARKG